MNPISGCRNLFTQYQWRQYFDLPGFLKYPPDDFMLDWRLLLDNHTAIRLLFHFELFDGMVFPQIESNEISTV